MFFNLIRRSQGKTLLPKACQFQRNSLVPNRGISEGQKFFQTVTDQPVEVEVGIVHLGVGRFHRGHQAVYIDDILQRGDHKWGICGVCMLPNDEDIFNAMKKQKCEYNVIERDSTTTVIKKIGSIVEVLWGHQHPEDVLHTLGRKSVKIVSLTVTEAGYFFHPPTKRLDFSNESIAHDLEMFRATVAHICSPSEVTATPAALNPSPRTLYGYLSISLLNRYLSKTKPFTVMSCDNLQRNGDVLQSLLFEFCEGLDSSQLKKPGKYNRFIRWLHKSVSFPCSVVDRITPAASEEDIDFLRYPLKDYDDFIPIGCELYRQWTIEDNFCNIKPKFNTLENVALVPDVKLYEMRKLRLLNGGHSALAYAGYLAEFEYVDEVASDDAFEKYLRQYFSEVSVTLKEKEAEGELMSLEEYQDTLMERFQNVKIRDDIARICKHGSSKVPEFVLPVIADALEGGTDCKCLSFAVASWICFIRKHAREGTSLDDAAEELLFGLVNEGSGADVGVFLKEKKLFGNVGDDVAFVSAVQEMCNEIEGEGVVVAMERLLQEKQK